MKRYTGPSWGYLPRSTCIHRLDPRVKLLALLGLMPVLILSERGVLLVAGLSLLVIKLARLPYRKLLRNLYTLKWLFIFALLFHLFFTPGRYLFAGGGPTYEGIISGTLISFRLILLVVASSILMLTTSAVKLTQGLESLLRPLGCLGIPVAELAMMTMLCLRFIPILQEETQRLVKAQSVRGITFSRTDIVHKAQNMLALFTPLILGAQRRAENIALSMQTRGYCSRRPRSRLYPLKLQTRDYVAGLIVVGIVLVANL
jgi:energy-coupling factor transport system permease protein